MRRTLAFAPVGSLPWGRLLILAAALLALASIAWPAQRAEAVDPVVFAVDCDMGQSGIQDDCTYPAGTAQVDVGVYAIKNGGADTSLGALQFEMRAEQDKFDPPVDFDPSPEDRNPDFNNAIASTGLWTCGGPPAPNPDTNADPAIADSLLSCFESTFDATPKLLGNGTPLLIMTVRYNVLTGDGSGVFTLNQGGIDNHDGSESYSCTVVPFVVPCNSATITIAPDPYDTPGGHMAIDCDMATPGIQDVCGVPMGTAQATVGLYAVYNGAGGDDIWQFAFTVVTDETKLDPITPMGSNTPPSLDWNPNANQAIFPPNYVCQYLSGLEPKPDRDPDPAVAESWILCSGGGPADSISTEDGQPRLLGTVTYNVVASGPGFADLSVGPGDNFVTGYDAVNPTECTFDPSPDRCHSARLYITGSLFDADGDGRNDVIDNCIEVPNTAQQNSDRIFDLPASKAFDDATRANSDKYGDVCDLDNDNDGLHDTRELAGAPCVFASAATDPLAMDTDGDRVADGAECLLGSDPANSSSLPAPAGTDGDNDGLPDSVEAVLESNPASTDSDGDSVSDGLEVRGWATSPASSDSDGDGCADKLEIASVNADQKVNSIDLSQVAQGFANAPDPGYIVEFDMNKDGKISSIDLSFVAQRFGDC